MSEEINKPVINPVPSGSGCARASAVSCLVVAAVLLGLSFFMSSIIKRNPVLNGMYSTIKLAAQCQMNMDNPNDSQNIHDALERYVTKNGVYPDKLEQLYPTFLKNRSVLHCPADTRPMTVVSYDYKKPDINAPGETEIIRCARHKVMKDQPPIILILRKNGKVDRITPQPAPDAGNPKHETRKSK